MLRNKDRLAFRRRLHDVEFSLLYNGQPTSGEEIRSALNTLAAPLGAPALAQIEALAEVASGARTRRDYVEDHGCGGVQRFRTRSGMSLYLLEAETFPGHVNNLYLVDARTRPGGGINDLLLLDAGSQFEQSQKDLVQARAVLDKLYEQGDLLDRVRHVVISHGHIDHFGGVAEWRKRGAHVYAHPFDTRVLTNFSERLIETSVYLRDFLCFAGCAQAEIETMTAMYNESKRMFQSVPIDDELYDGQDLHGLRVHHVPGHCPGQVMLQAENILLTADHLLARITPNQSPERITPWTGLDHYLASMQKTRALIEEEGIDLGLGGHEDPMPRPAERARETIEFHHARLRKILELCSEDLTVAEVAHKLFGDTPGYGRLLALHEAAAHVEYLARRGYLQIVNVEDLLKTAHPAIRYRAS